MSSVYIATVIGGISRGGFVGWGVYSRDSGIPCGICVRGFSPLYASVVVADSVLDPVYTSSTYVEAVTIPQYSVMPHWYWYHSANTVNRH